jgi:hypothetical protein
MGSGDVGQVALRQLVLDAAQVVANLFLVRLAPWRGIFAKASGSMARSFIPTDKPRNSWNGLIDKRNLREFEDKKTGQFSRCD